MRISYGREVDVLMVEAFRREDRVCRGDGSDDFDLP